MYAVGRRARRALDDARDRIAQVLNCRANEIIFTGCGSESDNLAIKGSALAQAEQRGWKHVVTSRVEHHAVLHACEWLEKHLGFEITYVDVDRPRRVDPSDVVAAVRPDTAVVSIMYANNEVGTIEPVAEIARAVKAINPGTVVHTDAVQAGGLMPLDVEALGVDAAGALGPQVLRAQGRRAAVRAARDAAGAPAERRRSGARHPRGHRERGVHRRHDDWRSSWRTRSLRPALRMCRGCATGSSTAFWARLTARS